MLCIDICSDLHIQSLCNVYSAFFNNPGDMLVIAGDISSFYYYQDLIPFFKRVNDTWKYTLVIPGNHEFYGEQYFLGLSKIKNFFDHFDNIHYIDNQFIQIDGIYFIGSILWTNMDGNNPIVKLKCKFGINDYNYIRWDENPGESLIKITPENVVKLFYRNVQFLEDSLTLLKSYKCVVITHHSPSYRSVADKYKDDLLNGGFVNNLESMIVNYPNVELWIHGHVHDAFDYKIRQCRVVCNPKGYAHENKGLYVPYKVEI